MKRMRRGCLYFVAGVSLLLCMAAMIDWYLHAQQLRVFWYAAIQPDGAEKKAILYTINTGGGRVSITVSIRHGTAVKLLGPGGFYSESLPLDRPNPRSPFLDRHGFFIENQTSRRNIEFLSYVSVNKGIGVPNWFLIGFFALLPAFLIVRRFVCRCTPRGLCAVCGYDLRATPERCPECGTVPSERGSGRVVGG